MHPSRIFDKPIGHSPNGLPPLQIVGVLPNYDEGVAYEGRLDIVDAVGDCRVELLENNLPPGHTAVVDNTTQEVVVRWPAYEPPETHKPGIINWNFASGDLEGWIDRRGNSWRVDDYPRDPGDSPPPYSVGSKVALMEGVGRGDHILESIQYPATAGQPVSARALWDQGPSNKDNNNLFTAIAFFRQDGSFIEPLLYGDRIHDRTNKNKHWSTASGITPASAYSKAVVLIAHRRNNRNRWISVSDVQTSGFEYPTGEPTPDKIFHLRIRVTDSANRVAYWSGVIISVAFRLLTTPPYPVVVVDAIYSGAAVTDIGTLGALWDGIASAATVAGLELEVTQRDMHYDHAPGDDAISSTALVTGLELIPSIIHTSYDHAGDDFISSQAAIMALDMEVTAAYINYDAAEPDDAITSTATITGLELQ